MNDELAVQVLIEIERDPSTWDQRFWGVQKDCGTAYCFAGHALLLEGEADELVWAKIDPFVRDKFTKFANCNFRVDSWIRGRKTSVTEKAALLLGISPGQADQLFNPNNTLSDLYRLVAEFSGLDETVLREKVHAAVDVE